MVELNGMDYSTNTAIFSISKAADLADLPTTTAAAVMHNGEKVGPVKAGSAAYMTDGSGKIYTLDGDTAEWVEKEN